MTLLYTSTGTGPYYPDVAPVLATEWWWLAQTEIMEMTKRGVPGVWTYNYYDGWVPNYPVLDRGHAQLHRQVLRNAELRRRRRWRRPRRRELRPGPRLRQLQPDAAARRRRCRAGRRPRPRVGGGQSREWYRPFPVPPEGVQWSGRANINMQQSALLIAMNAVAKNKEMFLENYYIKNKMMIEKGKTRAPYAYVIPAQQRRRAEAAELMNYFRREAVEVHTATAPFSDRQRPGGGRRLHHPARSALWRPGQHDARHAVVPGTESASV